MNRLAVCAVVALFVPMAAVASTDVDNSNGPFDVTSDTLFTGAVDSGAGGAGSYIVEFTWPGGPSVLGIADAAVTNATVQDSFTGLMMSWIDGASLNSITSTTGVDSLSTLFSEANPIQQLRFDWTDSVSNQSFRFDVTTSVETGVIPLPASFLLLGTALAGFGVLRRRKHSEKRLAA